MLMSKKHQKTIKMIFQVPVPSNVRWTDVESLFKHLGAKISEGAGSRMRVELNGVKAVFHRPHPKRETDKGVLMSVRRFLINAGYDDEV
jgi:hypothetical protein